MSIMDPRDEQDIAWLDARERGASSLPPIDARRAAAYAGVQTLIAALPNTEAPAGWEAEVMAALPPRDPASLDPAAVAAAARDIAGPRANRRNGAARRAPRAWLAGTAAVAAAAGLLLWLHQRAPSGHGASPDEPLSVRVVQSEGSRSGRGTAATIGDVLQVEAPNVGRGELRIYRDNREIAMRCPGQPGCGQEAGRLRAELRLETPGEYRAVYLQPAPPGPPTGTLAGDLAACHCEARTTAPVVAQ